MKLIFKSFVKCSRLLMQQIRTHTTLVYIPLNQLHRFFTSKNELILIDSKSSKTFFIFHWARMQIYIGFFTNHLLSRTKRNQNIDRLHLFLFHSNLNKEKFFLLIYSESKDAIKKRCGFNWIVSMYYNQFFNYFKYTATKTI